MRGPIHAGFALLAVMTLSAAGCGHHVARAKNPIAPARAGTTETGVASWYGIPYHGRRAASGEIYDMEKLTAAHRTLPFQTWIEVTNLTNGKQVDVRINDRGPFAHGRIIDLSHAAARDIEMLGPGTARVRLRVIPPPPVEVSQAAPAPAAIPIMLYAVQAATFADRDRAEALSLILVDMFADARVLAGPRNFWRVITGREMTFDEATALAERVRKVTGSVLVVPEPETNPAPFSTEPAIP